jgi:two-component system CheB/CheR fusion protein
MKRITSHHALNGPLSVKGLVLQPDSETVDAVDVLEESHEEFELENQPLSFAIVGIGASAGGLEAFTELLKHLPTDTGMGFVLVQHLDPQHESALTQLLARATSMPVREVTDNLRVEANHVYVIPPNTTLAIQQGILKLQARPLGRTPSRSIDFFFESLALDHRERAIGVILSGTATDGTIGLEAIKAEGGIAFAQDESARYDSMPRNAVAAGCVDFVFSPEKIAKELVRIAKHPYVTDQPLESTSPEDVKASATGREGDETPLPAGSPRPLTTGAKEGVRGQAETEHAQGGEDGFKKILLLLRNHSGVDFSLYKSSTIQRRITRRTVLSKQNTLEEYSRFLKGNAKELDALYSDVLISVTSFFRNPDAFDILKRKVFPKLLQQRGNDPLRVWVLGCSTGQEAYSITMAFTEAAENALRARKLQVFATDLNDALLDKARHGLYPKTLAEDVAPDRLRRFFVEEEAGYRVIKPLREMVVFARQNLINDPPFSRIDLISCRNVLIYFESSLQKKVIPTFHYALKPEGFLFLGASESVGGFTDLFEAADKKHKIYSKKAAPVQTLHLPVKKERGEVPPRGVGPPLPIGKEPQEPPEGFQGELNAQREADRVTVNQFAPPGVLINAELQIVQFRGPTGAYLQPPSTGKARFDVLKMAREGLMLPLRAAINKARKENKPTRKEKVRVQQNGKSRTVNLEVIPLRNLRDRCFLILFEDAEKGAWSSSEEARPRGESRTTPPVSKKEETRRDNALETELAETRDYFQSIQEQHEVANEELQASNEEVQSANEELQSMNEELETSKEELESANEELITVNEEMAKQNTELNCLNADVSNLQTSTKLPIVLLGRDLIIRRFSASAEKIFNFLSADVGRLLSGVRHNLVIPKVESAIPGSPRAANDSKLRHEDSSPYPIENLIREVIDTVREQEQDVRDRDGRWYSLRVRPYMTVDNKVDGAVLVLIDITERKQAAERVRVSETRYRRLFEAAQDGVLIIDSVSRKITDANPFILELLGYTREELLGKELWEIGLIKDEQASHAVFRQLQTQGTVSFEDLPLQTKTGVKREVEIVANHYKEDGVPVIQCNIRDITGRKRSEKELAEILAREQAANRAKDNFLAALSHELRTPLNPVLLLASDSANDPDLSPQVRANFDTICKNIELEARLIDDLLDLSRITHGKLVINQSELDVHDVLNDAISTVINEIEKKQIFLKLELHADSYKIFGDAVRLQQVFWNVLKNAMKFTHEGGQIRIESQTLPGDKILIKITDTGIGMDLDEVEPIFGAFAQGTHHFGGLGLGLAISRVLVELHSGSIRASSPGKGKGATFSIELPLIKLSEKEETVQVQPAPISIPVTEKKSGQGLHVLLVEDHEPTRLTLARLLLHRDYKVTAASSFAQAHSLMEENEDFHLLISDIGLPDGSGCDLMNEFQKKFAPKGIALTGYGTEHDVAQSQASGFTAHLTKPIRIESLERALADAI